MSPSSSHNLGPLDQGNLKVEVTQFIIVPLKYMFNLLR